MSSIFKDHDTPHKKSCYLLAFIPVVFSRMVCREFNIPFTDEYVEFHEGRIIGNGFLSKNRIFLQVYKLSENIIKSGLDSDTILKIAGRSPEFKIINGCLLKEMDASKIKFTSLYIII